MNISAKAVRFDEYNIWIDLSDGRTLGVPLAWFPRLLHATPDQRKRVELSRIGLHWEELDEDISITGLLAGRGDMRRHSLHGRSRGTSLQDTHSHLPRKNWSISAGSTNSLRARCGDWLTTRTATSSSSTASEKPPATVPYSSSRIRSNMRST
jgi:hypothetical protein